jgi:hypothetical protein
MIIRRMTIPAQFFMKCEPNRGLKALLGWLGLGRLSCTFGAQGTCLDAHPVSLGAEPLSARAVTILNRH